MSVNSWERRLSKVEFVWQTYLYNERLAQMLHSKIPNKYRHDYVDRIISTGLEALRLLVDANEINLNQKTTTQLEYETREENLAKAKSLIDHNSTVFFVLYRNLKTTGSIELDKFYKNCECVAEKTNKIIKLIEGTERSDKNRWDERTKKSQKLIQKVE